MILQGFITAVEPSIDNKTNEQRTWVSPEGTTFEYFNAHLTLVSKDSHGEEVKDTLCVEFSRTRSENNVAPYKDYIRSDGEPLNLLLATKEREYQGRYFNNLRLINCWNNGQS